MIDGLERAGEEEPVVAERLDDSPLTLDYRRPAMVTGRRTHEALASLVILAVSILLVGLSILANEAGGACIATVLFPVGMLLAVLAVMDREHQRKMALVALGAYVAIVAGVVSIGMLALAVR